MTPEHLAELQAVWPGEWKSEAYPPQTCWRRLRGDIFVAGAFSDRGSWSLPVTTWNWVGGGCSPVKPAPRLGWKPLKRKKRGVEWELKLRELLPAIRYKRLLPNEKRFLLDRADPYRYPTIPPACHHRFVFTLVRAYQAMHRDCVEFEKALSICREMHLSLGEAIARICKELKLGSKGA